MLKQIPESSSNNTPTTENILGQLDVEIKAAAPPAASAGWTTSGILAALLPLLWLLITQLSGRWNDPIAITYNWMLLFLLISLFFDACNLLPLPRSWRFFPSDIRARLQLANLFNHRVSLVDVIRYALLLLILWNFKFGATWYIYLMAYSFYGMLFLAGIAALIFDFVPVIVPIRWVLVYKQKIAAFLFGLGLILTALYLSPLINNLEAIHTADLLVIGLLSSLVYLLRPLTMREITPYIMALEDIRYDLASANISALTAKNRLDMVKSGMTMAETVNEYITPLKFTLQKMHEELQEAITILDPLPEFSHDAGTDIFPIEDVPQIRRRWLTHLDHYDNFLLWLRGFNRFCNSKTFRISNRLIQRYRRKYSPVLTLQSKKEMKDLFKSLWQEYDACSEMSAKYVESRHRFAVYFTEKSETIIEREPFKIKETLVNLRAILRPTEEALLKSYKVE